LKCLDACVVITGDRDGDFFVRVQTIPQFFRIRCTDRSDVTPTDLPFKALIEFTPPLATR
jgi:hypothetical protein